MPRSGHAPQAQQGPTPVSALAYCPHPCGGQERACKPNHCKGSRSVPDHDVQDYLDKQPEAAGRRLREMHALIERLYRDVEVSMKCRLPTFEWNGGRVAIANQKHYVSLYTCSAEHLEEFRLAHPEIRTGKGCIHLRDSDEVPLEDLASVVRSAMSKRSS